MAEKKQYPADCPSPEGSCPTECPRISDCEFACVYRGHTGNPCQTYDNCIGLTDCVIGMRIVTSE